MFIKLFALDAEGRQVYECSFQNPKESKRISDGILKDMPHVHRVVAIENVPNIKQVEDAFFVSYGVRFLFINER